MSYIGIINSEKEITEEMVKLLLKENIKNYQILSQENEIVDFINFELPDLLIINFSDQNINIESIMEMIHRDTWMNNFGIIGIFDQDHIKEEEIIRANPDFNILVLLDKMKFKIFLTKCIKIILKNRQLVINRDFSGKFFDKDVGSFEIENDIFAVSIYSCLASSMLSIRGLIKPESKMHLQLVLSELMINAIEHGNCGITYDEKTEFLEKGGNIIELVAEKCKDPIVTTKRVRVEWDITNDKSIFIIRDEGSGFDIFSLKAKIEKGGAYALHGRGLRMASLFTERLAYNRKGNAVLIQIRHEEGVFLRTPEGFLSEEVINIKKGEIVCKEGELSDSLFYISSGRYIVLHDNKKVGCLDPSDIFMGEMSFFLNNERNATVIAETDGVIINIPRNNFIKIIKKYPQYGLFLAKLLSRKLARSNISSAKLQNNLDSLRSLI